MIDVDKIAYERASFARDIEYLQSMAEDSVIQEAMCALDHGKGVRGIFESEEEDDPELLAAVDQIPVDNNTEQEEIKRILQSDHNMEIDDILGIADDITENNSPKLG